MIAKWRPVEWTGHKERAQFDQTLCHQAFVSLLKPLGHYLNSTALCFFKLKSTVIHDLGRPPLKCKMWKGKDGQTFQRNIASRNQPTMEEIEIEIAQQWEVDRKSKERARRLEQRI
jgi:hypothetical protein